MKITSFIFTILFAINLQAGTYQLVLNGQLVDGKGNGAGNKVLAVLSPEKEKTYNIEKKFTTLPSGDFRFSIEIPDTVQFGVLIIKYEDCNGKVKFSEFKFIKGLNLLDLKLVYCSDAIEKCSASITIKRINDSVSIAIVNHKGKKPFISKWSTGATGDTIRFNPLINGKFCVTTKDSTGCISEVCHINEKKCASFVLARKINDSSAIAKVVARGTGKSTHKWNTGATGDSIRFDPRNKIRICVISIDSVGCTSEACISQVLDNCVAGIERSKNKLFAYLKNDLPKSYKWSNGSEKESIEVKDTGTYCVRITGITGCVSEACFRVKEINTTKCEAEIVMDNLGNDNNSPGVKLSIKADYNLKFIKWNTGEKTPSIIAKRSGEYCVTISDEVNCKHFLCKKVEIKDSIPPCVLTIIQERIPSTNSAGIKDSAKIKLSFKFSSTAKIIYWSTGESTPSIIPTKSGEYCVTVSDGISCKQITCIKVEVPSTTPPSNTDCKAGISIKPISNKEVLLTAKLTGKSPLTFEWSTGNKESSLPVTKSGSYCLTLKDGAGCISKSCVDIEIDGSGLASPTDKINAAKNNNENKITLNVYPNPSPDKVVYNYSTIKNIDANLTIINVYGKMVYQEKVKLKEGKANGDVDISFLPPGIYQMVIDQQGTMVTQKIVIGR